MFATILAALDTDDNCSAVFAQALDLAKSTCSTLKLLGVVTPTHYDAVPLDTYYPGLSGYPVAVSDETWRYYQKRYEEYKEGEKSTLARFAQQAAAANVQAEVIQVEDTPGRAICDCAKTEEADLIIVGSHGRKGLSEIFMGSVSNYVMHHAPCSVMVVHAQRHVAQDEVSNVTRVAA